MDVQKSTYLGVTTHFHTAFMLYQHHCEQNLLEENINMRGWRFPVLQAVSSEAQLSDIIRLV